MCLYINLCLLWIVIILMINHITIIVCGIIINNSKWTILSSIRLILLYFMYDILFLLIILLLSPNNFNNILSINQYIESQYYLINLLKYPLLFCIYFFLVLIEAGRIPIDLIESESELISGYNIEYAGFLYALFASAEYSILLFHAILIYILFISYYSYYVPILVFHITIIIIIIIRSTLPRLKYTQLFILSFQYFLPITLCYLLLI